MPLAARSPEWRIQLRAAEHAIFSAVSLGELVRDFQHKVNDQLDHDRAFKLTLLAIPVNGVMPKLGITGGGPVSSEAMDVATGECPFSLAFTVKVTRSK